MASEFETDPSHPASSKLGQASRAKGASDAGASDAGTTDAGASRLNPSGESTLFSRASLLLATLLVLLALAVVAYRAGVLSSGLAGTLAMVLLLLCLLVGGFIRYRCRIGLRTFLVLVTALSVILAFVAQFAMEVRRIEQGVAVLRKDGIMVDFAVSESNEWTQTESGVPLPPFIVKYFGPAAVGEVIHADWANSKEVRADQIQQLIEIAPRLRFLTLYQHPIEPGALRGLDQMEQIGFVDLSGTWATNEDLADLIGEGLHVKHLYLRDTKIDAKGMRALRKSPRLEALWINGKLATDEAVEAVGAQTNMTMFLAHSGELTKEAIRSMAAQMPNLKNVNLNGNWSLDYQIAEHLKRMPKLQNITLSSTGVDDRLLDSLGATKLNYLDVNGTSVTKEGIIRFKELNPNCRILHSFPELDAK